MILAINNVTKTFKNKTAVSQFSMQLQKGECVGLIGPNGAGKSTLIKIIADILNPDSGEVLLNDQRISLMKKEIGYLPQYPNFFNWMSAKETLMFMGELSGLSKDELAIAIPEILQKVGLSADIHSKVGTFSGGMKQRLGIAQTLLHKPTLIVMDEPVSSLDPIGRREVLNLIAEIKKETTILLSTHILSDAQEICERFVIIKNGVKIEDTSVDELLRKSGDTQLKFEVGVINEQWINLIKHFPYVERVEVFGNVIKVKVDNIARNKNALLESALAHEIDILKFEIYNDTLEEIFLKLVVTE